VTFGNHEFDLGPDGLGSSIRRKEKKMNETPPSMKTRAFLIFCAVGLVPIALGYGAKPSASLDTLFGITVDTTNLTHIMRAVMGLYFGMVVIWVWGALKKRMTAPALVSCAVFMLGLAAGRILSLILDGMPHWLLVVYAALEIVLGLSAIVIYRVDVQVETIHLKTYGRNDQ
jgi:hypothetical protein